MTPLWSLFSAVAYKNPVIIQKSEKMSETIEQTKSDNVWSRRKIGILIVAILLILIIVLVLGYAVSKAHSDDDSMDSNAANLAVSTDTEIRNLSLPSKELR